MNTAVNPSDLDVIELRLSHYIGRSLSPDQWRDLDRLTVRRLGLLAELERPRRNWDGTGELARCGHAVSS